MKRLSELDLIKSRISRKILVEQLSKHSGVELRSCCAQQVSLILIFQKFMTLMSNSYSVPTQLRLFFQHLWPPTHDPNFSYILHCWRHHLRYCK